MGLYSETGERNRFTQNAPKSRYSGIQRRQETRVSFAVAHRPTQRTQAVQNTRKSLLAREERICFQQYAKRQCVVQTNQRANPNAICPDECIYCKFARNSNERKSCSMEGSLFDIIFNGGKIPSPKEMVGNFTKGLRLAQGDPTALADSNHEEGHVLPEVQGKGELPERAGYEPRHHSCPEGMGINIRRQPNSGVRRVARRTREYTPNQALMDELAEQERKRDERRRRMRPIKIQLKPHTPTQTQILSTTTHEMRHDAIAKKYSDMTGDLIHPDPD